MKRPPQPKALQHYLDHKYEDFNLWLDYWYQKSLLEETKPNKILEIGKGTGTLEMFMESKGFAYTTVDIDKKLKPDYVADILKMPFGDNSFDTVCAFEVLEHIPFSEFEVALREMARVSNKYVVISLPYASIYVGFAFQIFYMKILDPFFKILRLKPFEPSYINIAIPLFFLRNQGMIKAHAWELGRKGFPISRIRRIFKNLNLKLTKEQDRIFYPYHKFFILRVSK